MLTDKRLGGGGKVTGFILVTLLISAIVGKMPDHNTIILSEAECRVGLSESHLRLARDLYSQSGFVTLQNIWLATCCEEMERRTADVLSSLPLEDGYIHINRRSMLPQEIGNNKVRSILGT